MCYGGFSLSEKAMIRYAEIKNIPLFIEENEYGYNEYWLIPKEKRVGLISRKDWYSATTDQMKIHNEVVEKNTLSYTKFDRSDPVLVQVVEELGDEANGDCAELEIEEISSGTFYRIREYDGCESIETQSCIDWSVAK